MELVLIGHSVEDHLFIHGKEIVKGGGIIYAVMGILPFLEEPDRIKLITAISRENTGLFEDVYEEAGMDLVDIREEMPRVHLMLHHHCERGEKYDNLTDKLDVDFDAVKKAAGVYINMVTGYDINLTQLTEIRKNCSGLIYFDVHTFSRGVGKDMHREFRKIEGFVQWANNIDILQVNENEIFSISEHNDEIKAAEAMLECGVQILVVTRGDKGASVFYREGGSKSIKSVSVKALEGGGANKIGCGDVFGAVFFYHYIKNRDILKALENANVAGGLVSGYENLESYKKLKKDAAARLY